MKPINLEGMEFFEIESISVIEYYPLPDGQGKPTQVHLWCQMVDSPDPFVMRFRSPTAIDALIVALITHRRGVWGKAAEWSNTQSKESTKP